MYKFALFFINNIKKIQKWPDKEKEEKVLEEKVKSVLKEPLPEDKPELQLKVSLNQQSEDSPEEVVSRESHHSFMMIQDKSSRDSYKESLEMLSLTLNTLEEKPSLLWMLFTLLRDKEELSMDLEVDLIHQSILIYLTFYFELFLFFFKFTIFAF